MACVRFMAVLVERMVRMRAGSQHIVVDVLGQWSHLTGLRLSSQFEMSYIEERRETKLKAVRCRAELFRILARRPVGLTTRQAGRSVDHTERLIVDSLDDLEYG